MDDFASFPSNGILPKKETGALSFLSKYPDYDGRGIVIAILDTGVDPGAYGLQTTSDSKPKIIDLIDATGAGNVDISSVLTPDADGNLKGLSGRTLKVPSSWQNPSGKYHAGLKALFDLCSPALRERLRKERKETLFQPYNDEAVFELHKQLAAVAAATAAATANSNSSSSSKVTTTASTSADTKCEVASPSSDAVAAASNADESSKQQKDCKDFFNTLQKDDLNTRLDFLKEADQKIKDVGPVYDCLVWNDGTTWRACVDTTEAGNLEGCKVLTNYRDSHEFATFSYVDMLNYSVRILHGENVLEIVTDSGSHGTHVASIAAGYYEDKPELNGVAPGAQIVSIKIGDNRVNAMETAYALVNAAQTVSSTFQKCRHVIESRCDMVNYSFGEPINYMSISPAVSAIDEMIEKYGVIFCSSAGNNGPGIETVGAPASCSSGAISVAAYVNSDMQKAEHSLIGNGNSLLFTWSSRGPQVDGNLGVTICAPGGAFASVPNWTQRGSQLMSGTSMSSPNCCGCIALILSGLRANDVEFNPFGVKRAIQNTAQSLDEAIGTGAGLIQVDKAYDYMLEYRESIFQKIQFNVRYASSSSRQMRGIYLRNTDELVETRDYLITVDPVFFVNHSKHSVSSGAPVDTGALFTDPSLLESQRDKISLNRKLALVCDNNDNGNQWVECPSHLYLVNARRQFYVRIHADQLEEGRFYFTQIVAYDIDDPKRNFLFKIPISVVKPFVFDGSSKRPIGDYRVEFKNVPFKQGQIYRHFLRPPFGATHAELTLKLDDSKSGKDHTPLFYMQTFTLGKFRTPADSVKEEAHRLNNTSEFKDVFKVNANKIVQITIAKNWSNIGITSASYEIRLRGLLPSNQSDLVCLSSQPYRLDVGAYLRAEECEPTVVYKYSVQSLRPVENQIELVKPPLGFIKPIYQIVLTYTFTQTKTDEVCCEVPLLSNYLYENEYQSTFWMLFETNTKRHLLSGDAFPVLYKYARSLDKADYTVRLHVRHERIDMLDKLKDLSLNVRHALSASVQPDVYASYAGLLKGTGRKTAGGSGDRILKGHIATYYLNSLPDDKLPKGIANGHYLVGELSLFSDSAANKVDSYPITYQINNYAAKAKASKKADKTPFSASTSPKKAAANAAAPAAANAATGAGEAASASSLAADMDSMSLAGKQPLAAAGKSEREKMKEALRDIQMTYVIKSNEIYESVRHEYSEHVPLYLSRIKFLEQQIAGATAESERQKKLEQYDEIQSLCRTALDKINQAELLRFFGEHQHDSDENKKEFEMKRDWIVELLVCQGISLIEKQVLTKTQTATTTTSATSDGADEATRNELRAIYRAIQKWIDINDEKVSKFLVMFLQHFKYYGSALKLLFNKLEEKSSVRATDDAILNTIKQMQLKHLQRFFENHLILKYQKSFAAY